MNETDKILFLPYNLGLPEFCLLNVAFQMLPFKFWFSEFACRPKPFKFNLSNYAIKFGNQNILLQKLFYILLLNFSFRQLLLLFWLKPCQYDKDSLRLLNQTWLLNCTHPIKNKLLIKFLIKFLIWFLCWILSIETCLNLLINSTLGRQM